MATKLIPESICEVLEYRPDTGDFVWKFSQGRSKAGAIAGTPNDEGYIKIQWQGKGYLAHRVAYFLMTGEQPPEMIDHIDNCTGNNKWSNLRPSNAAHNGTNQRRQKNGICGVTLKEDRYWYACIQSNNKTMHLYGGKDFFEACCARKSAENRLHRSIQKMLGV